jgi:hypothetical protein
LFSENNLSVPDVTISRLAAAPPIRESDPHAESETEQ